MNIEDQKSLALMLCVDIAKDYSKEEVERFAPPSVQKAWEVGRETLDFEIAKDREGLKDFKL